jgi:hypothetical protein
VNQIILKREHSREETKEHIQEQSSKDKKIPGFNFEPSAKKEDLI